MLTNEVTGKFKNFEKCRKNSEMQEQQTSGIKALDQLIYYFTEARTFSFHAINNDTGTQSPDKC
jgi:hypothetical protein